MNQKKGRNLQLQDNRNAKLAARFYWYSILIGLKYVKCLEHMEMEFDISQSRIGAILNQNSEKITVLERSDVDVDILKNKYPYLSWTFNPTKQKKVLPHS